MDPGFDRGDGNVGVTAPLESQVRLATWLPLNSGPEVAHFVEQWDLLCQRS